MCLFKLITVSSKQTKKIRDNQPEKKPTKEALEKILKSSAYVTGNFLKTLLSDVLVKP